MEFGSKKSIIKGVRSSPSATTKSIACSGLWYFRRADNDEHIQQVFRNTIALCTQDAGSAIEHVWRHL